MSILNVTTIQDVLVQMPVQHKKLKWVVPRLGEL